MSWHTFFRTPELHVNQLLHAASLAQLQLHELEIDGYTLITARDSSTATMQTLLQKASMRRLVLSAMDTDMGQCVAHLLMRATLRCPPVMDLAWDHPMQQPILIPFALASTSLTDLTLRNAACYSCGQDAHVHVTALTLVDCSLFIREHDATFLAYLLRIPELRMRNMRICLNFDDPDVPEPNPAMWDALEELLLASHVPEFR
jgi:hypothetical protein